MAAGANRAATSNRHVVGPHADLRNFSHFRFRTATSPFGGQARMSDFARRKSAMRLRMIADGSLSRAALALGCYILERIYSENGYCGEPVAKLQTAIGATSERTVQAALNALVGYFDVQRSPGGRAQTNRILLYAETPQCAAGIPAETPQSDVGNPAAGCTLTHLKTQVKATGRGYSHPVDSVDKSPARPREAHTATPRWRPVVTPHHGPPTSLRPSPAPVSAFRHLAQAAIRPAARTYTPRSRQLTAAQLEAEPRCGWST